MGAWGLGLFQSDYDYDIIDDLTDEVGLDKLAEAANKAAAKDKKLAANERTKSAEEAEDEEIHCSGLRQSLLV